jgi:hypothetical protein|tara:strand:- start:155 stop:484 length:330 start_codon:yes stop_codon:yes gene_type:complete
MASELFKVALKPTVSNSEVKLIDGASGHTYVVLSISICETAGAAETFDLYVDDGDGGTDHYIYKSQAIGANETFVHNDRIVLEATDMLGMLTANSADLDVVVSYLDQTL